jgi:hypothetical protein
MSTQTITSSESNTITDFAQLTTFLVHHLSQHKTLEIAGDYSSETAYLRILSLNAEVKKTPISADLLYEFKDRLSTYLPLSVRSAMKVETPDFFEKLYTSGTVDLDNGYYASTGLY